MSEAGPGFLRSAGIRSRIRSSVEKRVVEHVPDCPTDFRWRSQITREVVVREHLAGAPDSTIQRASDADHERAHAFRERSGIVGLHDQVDVVRLHGEVHEAESRSLPPCVQRVEDAPENAVASKRGKTFEDAQDDVERKACLALRTRAVRDLPAFPRLPSGSFASTAPCRQLELSGSSRHDVARSSVPGPHAGIGHLTESRETWRSYTSWSRRNVGS